MESPMCAWSLIHMDEKTRGRSIGKMKNDTFVSRPVVWQNAFLIDIHVNTKVNNQFVISFDDSLSGFSTDIV